MVIAACGFAPCGGEFDDAGELLSGWIGIHSLDDCW